MRSAPASTASVVDRLRERADESSDRLAYSFLVDGEEERADLTYGALDAAARRWGAALRARTTPGDRALLVHPAGLEFVAAFFGCLYAGLVPVPVCPPGGGRRRDRDHRQLASVIADARPAIGLTTSGLEPRLRELPDQPLAPIGWLTDADLDLARAAADPDLVAVSPDDLAFLQYTSGSTREPAGVAVRHRDLMEQLEFYRRRSQPTDETVMVGWLPHYHDYGLIGFVLGALHMGVPYHFMSAEAFIARPSRWLTTLTGLRGTHTGGPTFAYGLCAALPHEERAGLDLSSLQVMSVGGDPVNAVTMDEFIAAFEPCGLTPSAVRPGYGLAEAVLSVSSPERGTPLARRFDLDALTGSAALPRAHGRGARLVALGTTQPGQELLIVDPQRHVPLPEGRVGEVWLRGASIAAGYWGRPDQTREVFGARLADGSDGPHLRTGDLGFVLDGQLFITGRLKDSIIVRGRSHAPQDIEWTVQDTDPALRRDGGAAFLVDGPDGGELVVVQEFDGGSDAELTDLDGLAERVRTAVAADHGLTLTTLELIRPGTLPRTTSGKVRHHACRAAFLARGFPDSRRIEPAERSSVTDEPADGVAIAVLAIVRTALAHPGMGPHDNLYGRGLDSLRALVITATLCDTFGVELPANEPFLHPSAAELATRVRAARGAAPAAPAAAPTAQATAVKRDAGPARAGAPEAGAPEAGAPEAGAPEAGASEAGACDAGAIAAQLERLTELVAEQTRLLGEIHDRLARGGGR